ncbi:MAG: zinc-binding dehydrogenase, partial [Oceanipulchritudo sp.]
AFSSSPDKAEEIRGMGAEHIINSRDPEAVEEASRRFDLILSTVNVKLDWNLYLSTLKPKGRLHFVGATLDPLDLSVFSLLLPQLSVSASPVGSPATLSRMLEFAGHHGIEPVVETFPMAKINEALERLKSGKARYRIVLEGAGIGDA